MSAPFLGRMLVIAGYLLVALVAQSFTGSNEILVARLSFSGRVERSAEDLESVTNGVTWQHPPQMLDVELGNINAGSLPSSTVRAAVNASLNAVTINLRVADTVTLGSDTTVFVFAKAPGSPMPLAAKRLTLAELPLTIELSDRDAMMITRPLSSAPRFIITARASQNHSTSAALGDWIGKSQPIVAANPPGSIDLVIDQEI